MNISDYSIILFSVALHLMFPNLSMPAFIMIETLTQLFLPKPNSYWDFKQRICRLLSTWNLLSYQSLDLLIKENHTSNTQFQFEVWAVKVYSNFKSLKRHLHILELMFLLSVWLIFKNPHPRESYFLLLIILKIKFCIVFLSYSYFILVKQWNFPKFTALPLSKVCTVQILALPTSLLLADHSLYNS